MAAPSFEVGMDLLYNANAKNVAASATSQVLMIANHLRSMATVTNDSVAAVLYLQFAPVASSTNYAVKIPAGGYYEFPLPVYKGAVAGIWDVASGSARMVEY